MSLPTLDKTWQFNVNQAIPATGTQLGTNRRILRTIKNGLLAFGTNPWTTYYSCNSVTAGAAADGVDRWTTDANLVWANAGTAHSWYVLQQAGVSASYQILISLEGASATGVAITTLASIAGFTGGTTTARPTATDEMAILTSANWGGASAAIDNSFRLHQLQSTDGQVTIVGGYVASTASMNLFWLFHKPKNPTTGWTTPNVTTMIGTGNNTATGTYAALWGSSTGHRARINGTTASIIYTSEGDTSGPIGQTQISANDIDGNYPILPMGFRTLTAAVRGRHGTVFDVFWGLENNSDGATYPSDLTRQFVQMSDIIVPWNGTSFLTA